MALIIVLIAASFGKERAFIRCRGLLRPRMSFVREHRECQRRRGESDEEAGAEDRRTQAGLEKSQHRRSTFSGSSSNASSVHGW
jgi:hypothetical protein